AAGVLSAACSAWSDSHPATGHSASSQLPRLPNLSELLGVIAGIGIAVVPAAVYLATRSALRPMLDHFRRHAVAYEEAKGIALPPPTALLVSGLAAIGVVLIGLILHRVGRRLVPPFCALVILLFLVVIAAGERGPSGPLYRS